ncbi:hypothetical protein EYF80_045496 [Liparis tanakae]|uniref:Uncharacterized protein n=1 Tax=Liparis tanakae TaxID=230148 RepID=A0A4Z2FSU3_9TELE|nr:hypothetical protein EYF80_045496 [Liparis tanakae]
MSGRSARLATCGAEKQHTVKRKGSGGGNGDWRTHGALTLGHSHGVLHFRRHHHRRKKGPSGEVQDQDQAQNQDQDQDQNQDQDQEERAELLAVHLLTPLMSLLISLLWTVSRVSGSVVNEPHCMSFLLAALYLLWGRTVKIHQNVHQVFPVSDPVTMKRLPLTPASALPWRAGSEACPPRGPVEQRHGVGIRRHGGVGVVEHKLTSLDISAFFMARRVNLSSTTGITHPFIISLSYLYSTFPGDELCSLQKKKKKLTSLCCREFLAALRKSGLSAVQIHLFLVAWYFFL